MEDGSDPDRVFGKRFASACLREAADSDELLGLQYLDQAAQVRVAGLVQPVPLGARQLVRRTVPPRRLHEDERAVVRHEEVAEEALGLLEVVAGGTPEPRARDLAPLAAEALDGTLRVLALRSRDASLDPQPIPHQLHLAEGNAGLHHAVGARIHAQEDDPLRPVREAAQVRAVRRGRVLEWVVDVRHRRPEAER